MMSAENSHNSSDDLIDLSPEQGAALDTEETMPSAVKNLPFAYAAAEGVFVDNSLDELLIVYKPGLRLEVLAELRRYLAQPFNVEAVDDGEFQRRLTAAYQKSSGEAALAAEEIGADMDLDRLADEIPEAADLM
ncbi:MAG: type II secretion system protein GspE, partial [Pseudomonadales bacterium]|nr:type II secretion system protein GspE [Pseudomonadales bacterium]